MIAAAMDEPTDPRTVCMLEALPPDDSEFYRDEQHVLDPVGKSTEILRELEQQYCFVGGPEEQYLLYLHRSDLPPNMWRWETLEGT